MARDKKKQKFKLLPEISKFRHDEIAKARRELVWATDAVIANGPKSLGVVGSLVRVRRKDGGFDFWTASHVEENARELGNIETFIDQERIGLNGALISTTPDGTSADDDPIDAMVIRPLPGLQLRNSWEALSAAARLPSYDPQIADDAIAHGLPITRQKNGAIARYSDLWFDSLVYPLARRDEVMKAGYDPEQDVLIRYRREHVFSIDGNITGVNPRGISGGGLWKMPRDIGGRAYLLGIVRKIDVATNWIVATRVNVFERLTAELDTRLKGVPPEDWGRVTRVITGNTPTQAQWAQACRDRPRPTPDGP